MFDRAHAYRPEIDGLGAFAVLPVILFHAGACDVAATPVSMMSDLNERGKARRLE